MILKFEVGVLGQICEVIPLGLFTLQGEDSSIKKILERGSS